MGAAGDAEPSGPAKPFQLTHPELWQAYRDQPGEATRNRLVETYHAFAREIVRRFSGRLPRSVDRGDLETAGSVGLISAVEGYDPERGVRFESYCELRVKGALLDELRTQDWLPRPWRQRMELRKRTTEALRSELGREPDDRETAQAMGLGDDEYQRLFGMGVPMAPTGSMAMEDQGDEYMPVLEAVPDTHSEVPGDRLTREDLLTLVAQKLTDQEYRIVYLKYWEDLTMREIGELTQLSESRVCKIHTRLILRLRERFGEEEDGIPSREAEPLAD
ncbi:MAG TPA: sigma-70 family RNA polymerase sigma factor [Planctomycetota bacterium]|nr:sigma-70 family RNA polymerase sigma factor [Planctomycetota bacterium]HRV80728.1 sigma-70 family RNA polymerase sigma factor [Planctomycetota bacterium]